MQWDGYRAGTSVAPNKQFSLNQWKEDVFRRLGPEGVCRAYSELGIRFDGSGIDAKGRAVCHAIDRPDDMASAVIFTGSGIYHAAGPGGPVSLGLIDFALQYGNHGDFKSVCKWLAELSGVPFEGRQDAKQRYTEATHDYHNAVGDLAYQIIKYRHPNGKKKFSQRRPDGKRGWIYNLDDVRRFPYRLPEIQAHPDALVVVVEGEKDADRLMTLVDPDRVQSTTNSQGANDTARWEELASWFEGREVVVIPDNDPPGRTHGHGVARWLSPVARSTRFLELPGLGKKGDLSDWLDLGNGADDLWRLIAQAPRYEDAFPNGQPEEAPAGLDDSGRDATAADLRAANLKIEWLWENWIPRGVLTLLAAEPGTGKTRFCLDLNRRIAKLLPWPDGSPMGDVLRRVLWIPADNQHSELAEAPERFDFPQESLILNTSVSDLYGGTELQSAEDFQELEERIKRVHPDLVIIDTITNTSELKSQDTVDAKKQYKPLQEIARRTNTAIICVTHTNAGGKTLGRRADEKARVTIRLEKPDEEQPNRRRLSVAMTRLSVTPKPLGVTMGDGGNEYDLDPPSAEKEAPAKPGQGGKLRIVKTEAPFVKRAKEWLDARLKKTGGEARVSVLRRETEELDPPINPRALYAARDALGLEELERDGKVWWRFKPSSNAPASAEPMDPDCPF